MSKRKPIEIQLSMYPLATCNFLFHFLQLLHNRVVELRQLSHTVTIRLPQGLTYKLRVTFLSISETQELPETKRAPQKALGDAQ